MLYLNSSIGNQIFFVRMRDRFRYSNTASQHHGLANMSDLDRSLETVVAWSGLASALVLIAYTAVR